MEHPHENQRSARERAFVKMFEIVDASGWTSDKNGAIDDLRPLILMMDIGSCASAEKHTGVNCVTVSMGDVVIENYPKIGQLLELHASPVDIGKTSLNIAVTVFAHGSDDDNDDDDNNDTQPKKDNSGQANNIPFDTTPPTHKPAHTQRVCEAFFTYVTTRGPNGEKRFVPPLETTEDVHGVAYASDTTWERTLARFRKQLIRSEQSSTSHPKGYTIPFHQAIFESSEVVLPSHQNHMDHLFGGIVMGWMCKSVQAACVKACRLPLQKFRIRTIQRVDFPQGADVSDHIFLRPRITAIFDGGRSAEVEVMVGKRPITSDNSVAAGGDAPREETTLNFGYFYVSGSTSMDSNNTHRVSTNTAPFAGLLRSRQDLSEDSKTELIAMAHQRRNAMLARKNLLDGIGKPILWDSSLEVQAPLLTILSLLRLCNEYEKSPALIDGDRTAHTTEHRRNGAIWKTIQTPHDGNDPNHTIQWTYGDSWGHQNTVLICSKTIFSRQKLATGKSFLEDFFWTLCGDRCNWDPCTKSVRVLEQKQADEHDENAVDWDVAEYNMEANGSRTTFCLLRAGSYIGADGSILTEGEIQNQSVTPAAGVLASRSVRHEASTSTHRVLPSGFLLKTVGEQNQETEFLEITYVAEHDFDGLRKSGAFGTKSVTDDYIVCFLASYLRVLFAHLASMNHRTSN